MLTGNVIVNSKPEFVTIIGWAWSVNYFRNDDTKKKVPYCYFLRLFRNWVIFQLSFMLVQLGHVKHKQYT